MKYIIFFDQFVNCYNGVFNKDLLKMFEIIGVQLLDQFIDEIVLDKICLKREMDLLEVLMEFDFFNELKCIVVKNKVYKIYIGMGYYGMIMFLVIFCNVF